MFAGMKGTGIFLGISVEEGLAELTAVPSCVVLTCIAHTTPPLALQDARHRAMSK